MNGATRGGPAGPRRLIAFRFSLNVGAFAAHEHKTQIVAAVGLRLTDELAWVVRPASPSFDGSIVIQGAVTSQNGVPVLSLDFCNTSAAGAVLGDIDYKAYIYRA